MGTVLGTTANMCPRNDSDGGGCGLNPLYARFKELYLMFIYKIWDRQTDRRTNRQTDKQTNRQADKQTEIQTNSTGYRVSPQPKNCPVL